MKLYNKTTSKKIYGAGNYTITLPASAQDGERGPAVDVSTAVEMTKALISMEAIKADQAAGRIDLTP